MAFLTRRAFISTAALAISLNVSWSLATETAAASLLKSNSTAEPAAVERTFKADKTLIRKRLVDIDQLIIAAQILPKGSDRLAGRAKQSKDLGGVVTLELFPGTAPTFSVKHVEDAFAGGVAWRGGDSGTGEAILVVNNGKVTGSIEANGRSFIIEPTGRGSEHRVREIDTEALPNDVHLALAPKPGNGNGGSTGGTTGDTGGTTTTITPGTILPVRILAAYTKRAYALLGGVPADKITLDVAIVNQGFANSGVPMSLKLAGVTAVSSTYDEKTYSDAIQPLRDLTSGSIANFGAIRVMRNTLAADLVTMYVDRGEYCGVAWVNGTPPNSAYGFSVINQACAGTPSLAHELGHNMGLRHDRYVEAVAPSSVYNYGFVSTLGKFRDIMSYNNACAVLGFTCPRITYYSNPKLQYNGRALGIPQGTTGAADATRKLAEQATAVAAFR